MAHLIISAEARRSDSIATLVTLCFDKAIHLAYLDWYIDERDSCTRETPLGQEDSSEQLICDFLRRYAQAVYNPQVHGVQAWPDSTEIAEVVVEYLELRAAHCRRFDRALISYATGVPESELPQKNYDNYTVFNPIAAFNFLADRGDLDYSHRSIVEFLDSSDIQLPRRIYTSNYSVALIDVAVILKQGRRVLPRNIPSKRARTLSGLLDDPHTV